MFLAQLHNKKRGADPQNTPLFYFCVHSLPLGCFNRPLPSNELFRLSGVMSQYLTLLLRMVEVPFLTLGPQTSYTEGFYFLPSFFNFS
jgi:hypothetical protein